MLDVIQIKNPKVTQNATVYGKFTTLYYPILSPLTAVTKCNAYMTKKGEWLGIIERLFKLIYLPVMDGENEAKYTVSQVILT